MADIFGPGQTAGPVTQTRPSNYEGQGTPSDTWFLEGLSCADSTELRAEWLNFLASSMRQAVRTSGAAENLNDPRMLAEALARYGGTVAAQTNYVNNQYDLRAIGSMHSPSSYFNGMRLVFTPSIDNVDTAPTFVRVENQPIQILPYKKVLDWEGNDLEEGDFTTNRPAELIYNDNADGGSGAFIFCPWSNTKSVTGVYARQRSKTIISGQQNLSGMPGGSIPLRTQGTEIHRETITLKSTTSILICRGIALVSHVNSPSTAQKPKLAVFWDGAQLATDAYLDGESGNNIAVIPFESEFTPPPNSTTIEVMIRAGGWLLNNQTMGAASRSHVEVLELEEIN